MLLQWQIQLSLANYVYSSVESLKSMKFMGNIQGLDIVILLDLRCSRTFINSTIAAQLSRLSSLSHPLSVKVATGTNVVCDAQM
jgi:hypothetical protein